MGTEHITLDAFIDDMCGEGAHVVLRERNRLRRAANSAVSTAILAAMPNAVLVSYDDVTPPAFSEDERPPREFHEVETHEPPLLVHNAGAPDVPCGAVLSWRDLLELLHAAGRVPEGMMPTAEQMLRDKEWNSISMEMIESMKAKKAQAENAEAAS